MFSYFEKKKIGSIKFSRKIINMTFPAKICITFQFHLFNTFSWICSFTTQHYFQNTVKFILLRFEDCHLSFFTCSEISSVLKQLTRCFKSSLAGFPSFLIELPKQNRLVSSANWWTFQHFIAWLRLFTNRYKYMISSFYLAPHEETISSSLLLFWMHGNLYTNLYTSFSQRTLSALYLA